jgi:hypothetical protein
MDYSDKEIQLMANRDPRVKKALKRSVFLLVPTLLGVILSSLDTNNFLLVLGGVLFIVGFIPFIAFMLSVLLVQKKVRAEIVARLQKEEEDRLAQVKATMTPAEWQAYMLELENNRLLKELARRSTQKSTTRTVFGYTEGG